MKKIRFLLVLFLSFSLFLFSCTYLVKAATEAEISQKIDEYQQEIDRLQKEEQSLSQQISLMDSQIKLATAKINQTEKQINLLESEIATLSGKINRLDGSLNYLSKVLLARVSETYKSGKLNMIDLLFSAKNFSEFVSKYRYLQTIQSHDRELLFSMEQTRTNYDEQKQLKEKIQTELETLQKKLETQKKQVAIQANDRKRLLEQTRGKESEYQRLLADSKNELEAIQAITSGNGKESEIGKVGQGSRIASIISGASPCSTGTHLHFEVRENNEGKDPFIYLKNIYLVNDSGGDPANARGDWEWPLNGILYLNQGYGADTSAIRSKIVWYKFHTGIDIVSSDLTIKAVKEGTLYRGGIACGKGTLRYVKLHHEGTNLDTYYLHVNY